MFSSIRTRACALAAIACCATAFSAPASHAAVQRGVDGTNVAEVRHTGGGRFEQIGSNRWIEYGDEGAPIHEFEEERRDRSGVVLLDTRRGTRIWINLANRTISGGTTQSRARELYRILDMEARRGGWNDRRDDWRDDRRGDRWERGGTRDVEVGPIWNQADAERKCRDKAREVRGEWDGNWHTTVPGRMSVCSIETGRGGGGGWRGRDVVRGIEVGPIWNQSDAEMKCRNKAREMRGEWTGQWRTTIQGRMSVCEIRFR